MRINERIPIRHRLTNKLFLALFLVFTIILAAIFFGITRNFESYFIKKEINRVYKSIDNYLSNLNNRSDIDKNQIKYMVKDYTEKNENPLFIVMDKESFYPPRIYSVKMKTNSGEVNVNLDEAIFQLKNIGVDIKKGMELSFYGFWTPEGFMGLSIYDFSRSELSDIKAKFGKDEDDIELLKGIVSEYNVQTYEKGSIYKQDKVFEMTKRMKWENISPDKRTVIENIDSRTGIKNYLIIIPLGTGFAVSLYSTQSVDRVIKAIPEFLSFAVLVVIILLIGLLYFLSRLIVSPVLRVNEVTQKIAHLDFSDKLEVSSKDEIGMISLSVNEMGNKLEEVLKELGDRNAFLQEQLELKEELEESRKRFVADASHELKTPLGIVRAYTERIEDKYLKNERGREYTRVILDENKKMNLLLNELLELSKLESNTECINYGRWNLTEVIEGIYSRFEPIYGQKKIELFNDVEPEIYACFDLDKMERVFLNIFSNAVKYTPDNGKIFVSLSQIDEEILFKIKNEVEDIENIDTQKIWNRFYKVDSARSRDKGGTGLGLAITKSILEAHGFRYGARKEERMIEIFIQVSK